jgi:hypothetical protein
LFRAGTEAVPVAIDLLLSCGELAKSCCALALYSVSVGDERAPVPFGRNSANRSGAGAFRNFKDTLRRHGIESAWFAFRAEALREIALNWCEDNHIVWE